jgi:arsenate reductase (thioredoxin)
MTDTNRKTKVLFVCTANAARSQMAEGWTRALWSDRIEVHSAGVMPAGVSPYAAKVMKEKGVDLSTHRSKHVSDVKDVGFDFVITLCDSAKNVCPRFEGDGKRIHRGFVDPPSLARYAKTEEDSLSAYRRVRDEIRAFVDKLPEFLGLP